MKLVKAYNSVSLVLRIVIGMVIGARAIPSRSPLVPALRRPSPVFPTGHPAALPAARSMN